MLYDIYDVLVFVNVVCEWDRIAIFQQVNLDWISMSDIIIKSVATFRHKYLIGLSRFDILIRLDFQVLT